MSQARVREPRLRIDGVVLFDKPCGMSSNAALQTVRRLYRAAKAGHTGTLDPMASGLLPLCLGEATKFSQMLLDADKTYVARVKLGQTTNTGDAEGEVLETRPVNVTEADIDAVLPRFRGAITQIPPMYSALKRDGKPLYAYAREGVTLEREARQVSIHHLARGPLNETIFELEVACSKGTYIRTLAEDIGAALGCGAHLVALRRTRIGPFALDAAVDLPALEASESARTAALRPVDLLASHLPCVALDEAAAQRFMHGQVVQLTDSGDGVTRVFAGPRFLGLGIWRPGGALAPQRLLADDVGA